MGKPFRTTVIGSYFRRDSQALRRPTLSREEANAAARWAIDEQVRAGMDIITDGEQRRESFITFVQRRMTGFDFSNPAPKHVTDEYAIPVARVTGRVTECRAGLAEDYAFARACAPTHVEVKMTCAGPHVLAAFTQNEHYPSEEALAMDIAAVLNAELKRVVAAGCPFIQIDEPHWSGTPHQMAWAARAFQRAVEGLGVPIGLHVCFGNPQRRRLWHNRRYHDLLEGFGSVRVDQVLLEYCTHPYDVLSLFDQWDFQGELALGVVDVKSEGVETPEVVVDRMRPALTRFPPERLLLTSECGYIYTPPHLAFGKMRALAGAAQILRGELRAEGGAGAPNLAG